MTRITLWTLSTISVLALLFGYHTSTMGPGVSAAPPAAFSGSVAGSTTTSGDTATAVPDTSDSSDSTDSTDSTDSSDSSGSAATTFTGDTAGTRWGDVQVAITVADGQITDVQVPVYPTGNHEDEEINSYALPVLIQSTLDAQSADIDMVSGATVTSVGYQESLQSALDQAGL